MPITMGPAATPGGCQNPLGPLPQGPPQETSVLLPQLSALSSVPSDAPASSRVDLLSDLLLGMQLD